MNHSNVLICVSLLFMDRELQGFGPEERARGGEAL